MARRKRKSTGSHKRSGGGGRTPNWKKSKGLAVVLVATIILTWGVLIVKMLGPAAPTFKAFPYTYITEEEDAKPIVIKRDSNKRMRAPFKKDGKWYWDAYQCNNPDCPARSKDGKPFIFPYVIPYQKKRIEAGKPPNPTPEELKEMEKSGQPMMEMEMMGMEPRCPACESENLDSFNVQPYLTPEGRKMKEEYRKRMEAEHARESGRKKKKRRRRK